jgi:hypothetical protein
LKRLEFLNLAYTTITDEAVNTLEQLPALRGLEIKGTKIGPLGKTRLGRLVADRPPPKDDKP